MFNIHRNCWLTEERKEIYSKLKQHHRHQSYTTTCLHETNILDSKINKQTIYRPLFVSETNILVYACITPLYTGHTSLVTAARMARGV